MNKRELKSEHKEKRVRQTALDELLSEEQDISISNLYYLSDLPPEDLAQFKARWPHLSDERRHLLARHLADISEENFQVDFSPLCDQFLSDPLPEVRQAALDSLWDTTNLSLIDPIIALMQADESTEVRALAAATLGHYVLMAQWGELPEHIEPPIVHALLEQLHSTETDPMIKRAALESIASSPHPAVNGLIEVAYENGDALMQLSALFAMGRSADRRWTPTLLEELENYESAMRLEAARAAGAIGDSRTVPQLVEMAYYDEDLEVRLAAVHSLGQIGGETVLRALTDLSEDPESEELYEAIDAALEEAMWLGGEIDFSLLDWDVEDRDELT